MTTPGFSTAPWIPDRDDGTYRNPVLFADYSDPDAIRVGDDYWLVASSFSHVPGLPILHSRDLVNWRLLTRPLTRVSQLDMRGIKDSGGVWAPCLSHFDGTYYLVYTNALCQSGMHGGPMNDLHNFLVTAPDIMGPWSEPVHLVNAGFDPSLFHDDDGRKWFLWTVFDYRPMYFMQSGRMHLWQGLKMFSKFGADGVNPFKGIMMQEYSHDRKKLIGEPKLIFTGTKLGVTEGPHLYKYGGYYHLMTAEGGTGRDHAVTMARSRAIDGPYEVHPDNPLLTSRGRRGLALQKAGHGSLVMLVGEAGVGKTRLAQEFTDLAGQRGAVVLSGRCYERETVPFKAVDGVVDVGELGLEDLRELELDRHLGGLLPQPVPANAFAAPAAERYMPQCPQCGASALVKVEGCNNCLECGYSKCG